MRRAKTPAQAKRLVKPPRLDIVDAARGVAIAMMIGYHFCFDLTYYGWAQWAMLDDPRWVAWRTTIVANFLVLVGISLALRDAHDQAHDQARDRARDRAREQPMADRRAANEAFVRRWLQVAAAALFVTAGSALLFSGTFIYFGVLHFVVVALWLCRRAPRLGAWAMALGVIAIALGTLIHDPAFDARSINWIGFSEHKPLTEDYVPLFPWLGVALIGCGLGALWTRRGCRLSPPVSKVWQATPHGLRALLATAGRWSLTIYLVHQPILIGAMGLIKQLR